MSYAPFWTYLFSALFFYMLWCIELKLCIWLCNQVSQIKFTFPRILSIFEWVMPLFGLRILVFHTFCPFLDLEYWFSALFSYILSAIELKFYIRLCSDVSHIKFTFPGISSIFEWVMPLFGLRTFVFRTLFLHALMYWAEILYMAL